jgi:anti-anti-sigma factor
MKDDFSLTDLETRLPVAVLLPSGRVNSQAARDLLMRCEALVDEGYKHVIVKLSDVTFIASSGAGTLVKLTYDFREWGGSFQIADVSEPVMRVIDLLNSRQFLNIAADVEEAKDNLDALNKPG